MKNYVRIKALGPEVWAVLLEARTEVQVNYREGDWIATSPGKLTAAQKIKAIVAVNILPDSARPAKSGPPVFC